MKADTVVPLLMHLPTSWTDPLCHLCARGWVDPNEASEITKSEKKTLNEIRCLQKQQTPSSCGDELIIFPNMQNCKKTKNCINCRCAVHAS